MARRLRVSSRSFSLVELFLMRPKIMIKIARAAAAIRPILSGLEEKREEDVGLVLVSEEILLR